MIDVRMRHLAPGAFVIAAVSLAAPVAGIAGPVATAGYAVANNHDRLVQPANARKRSHRYDRHSYDGYEYGEPRVVDAPYTHVETGRRVIVDAPFTQVYVGRGHGVHVRAPFVDLWIPH